MAQHTGRIRPTFATSKHPMLISRLKYSSRTSSIVVILVGLSLFLSTQSFAEPSPQLALSADDSIEEAPRNSVGKALSLGGLTTLYAGLSTWAYFAWYDEAPKPFEFNDDGWFGRHTYAGGADKFGHMFSNYLLFRVTADILEYGGWSPLQSSYLSAGITTLFFTLVEVKDGFHYAFSISDAVFNTIGCALGIAMRHWPALDAMFSMQLQYFPSPEYRKMVRDSGNVNIAEDYSGQTYLFAYHLSSIDALDSYSWLKPLRYLDLALGFQATNYKPKPLDQHAIRQQEVFLGLSLNLQQLLNDTAFKNTTPESPRALRITHSGSNFITEYFSLPYSTLRVTDVSRQAP